MQLYIKKQMFIACCLYTGQILAGFSLGWSAPVILKLQDPDQSPIGRTISEAEASWVGSLLYVGSITGPYASGYLSNIIGRKPCLILGGVVNLATFLMLTFAQNLAMIFTGRILNGLGSGIIFIVSLVYVGEIASANIRGILLTTTGIFSTLGTLIMYSIGPYISYKAVGFIGLGLTLVFIIAMLFIPETPVFHVLKGEENKAIQTLVSLGRRNDINNVIATKSNIELNSRQNEWIELFTLRINRRALFITLTISVLQQMSGVMVVIFFVTSIFEMAGSSIEPNIATIIIGVTQLAASVVAPFFVERSGRKFLLLASTAFCCFSLGILGIYFYLDNIDHSSVGKIQWLPLVTLILFFVSYDFGFGIIPSTLIGEMYLPNVRSTGSTVTVTGGWLCGFIVSTAFGYMITSLGGHITFWMYSCICALAFVFTILFIPETKGKSLMEIQEMLGK